jgi:hypothetical protein
MKIKLLVELFTLSVMGQYAEFCGWALTHLSQFLPSFSIL